MNAQQLKGSAWLLGAGLLAFAVAAGVPYFAARVPWPVEKRLAAVMGDDDRAPCGQNRPESAAALAKLTKRLYPVYPEDAGFPLTVEVVPGATVNAFAGLGGRVRVFDGLLQQAQSPEELAGVLAHEIEHVRRRHIIQGLAARLLTLGALKLAFSNGAPAARALLNMSFGRQQEHEADEGGLKRLRQARIDTAGFASFFERAENSTAMPALLSDHPSSSGRAELARRYAGGASEPILNAQEWRALQSICKD